MKNTDVKDYFEMEQIETERVYAIHMKDRPGEDPIEINYDNITEVSLKEDNGLLIVETIKEILYRTMIDCSNINFIQDEY